MLDQTVVRYGALKPGDFVVEGKDSSTNVIFRIKGLVISVIPCDNRNDDNRRLEMHYICFNDGSIKEFIVWQGDRFVVIPSEVSL